MLTLQRCKMSLLKVTQKLLVAQESEVYTKSQGTYLSSAEVSPASPWAKPRTRLLRLLHLPRAGRPHAGSGSFPWEIAALCELLHRGRHRFTSGRWKDRGDRDIAHRAAAWRPGHRP